MATRFTESMSSLRIKNKLASTKDICENSGMLLLNLELCVRTKRTCKIWASKVATKVFFLLHLKVPNIHKKIIFWWSHMMSQRVIH